VRNFVTRVNGGEDFRVQQKGQSAPWTRTVLDRANVAYILVVPTVRQEYLYIKILVQKLNAVMERFASLKDPGLDAAARLAAFHAAAFNEYVVLMVLHIKATVI